jgi:hypothetical protein
MLPGFGSTPNLCYRTAGASAPADADFAAWAARAGACAIAGGPFVRHPEVNNARRTDSTTDGHVISDGPLSPS